jgi:hypothetical protein
MKIYLALSFLYFCIYSYSYAQTYDEIAYKAYMAYNKASATNDVKLYRQAGSLLIKAAGKMKAEKETILWDAAMIYAMAKDTAQTFAALKACLAAGMTDVEKLTTRPVFDFIKSRREWTNLIYQFKAAEKIYIARLKDSTLRKELLLMWAEDQRVRFVLREKVRELKENWSAPELEPLYKEMKETDSVHFRRIRQIITENGWPKISMVGKDGSFAAWAIVQHSNLIDFQEACTQAIKPLLTIKEVNPADYANLVDRVRFNKKEKQLYGMVSFEYPIEDAVHIDERRKQIGLVPMTVYAHLNGFKYKQK